MPVVEIDPDSGDAVIDKDGFAIPSGIDEPGVLPTKPRLGLDTSVRRLR